MLADRRRAKIVRTAVVATILVGTLAACSLPPKDPIALAEYREVNDPLEPTNRFIFSLNLALDTFLLQPIAVAYRDLAPEFMQRVVRNVLFNARLPLSFAHAVLQGNGEVAERTASRFATNMLFLWTINIEDEEPLPIEDAGQTFAIWSDPAGDGGPYLMLPLFGPSNARDALGTGVDFFADPLGGFVTSTEVGLARAGATAVDERSRTIEEVRDLQRNSLDFYAAVRSLYRQRRAQLIRNDEVEPTLPAPTIGVDFPSLDDPEDEAAR